MAPQYDVRAAATGGTQTGGSYIVGQNDAATANALRLRHEEYPPAQRSAPAYLAWVKAQTRRGAAPTICVYCNECLFYGHCSDPSAGDPEYDHITSVVSVSSAFDDDLYHPEDVLVFSDHGLWAPGKQPQYYFRCARVLSWPALGIYMCKPVCFA